MQRIVFPTMSVTKRPFHCAISEIFLIVSPPLAEASAETPLWAAIEIRFYRAD